jgi:hypothetical protein
LGKDFSGAIAILYCGFILFLIYGCYVIYLNNHIYNFNSTEGANGGRLSLLSQVLVNAGFFKSGLSIKAPIKSTGLTELT